MANRTLIVEIAGDASSLDREFKRATQAAGKFSGTLKEQAAQAITAQVGERRELEKLAAEYRLVARNAKQGSEAQVTAAHLATNAERRLASSFAVVNRETRRSAGGFMLLHGEVGKASRGALAGSGVFRSLGRSIAFASGGFLAFATIGDFLRKSIDAAKEAQVTQKQLGAQFRAAGKDLGVYQAEIEKTANHLSLLAGFENDEIKAGFTTIFRTTGSVAKALRDLATAADLARAKHLGFAQASLIIAKTEAGNTTLLRRQGFQIAKNATAEEALAVLRAKVAGQAKAGTTAQERFGAVLHNTEEIIGAALLPTLNKYLTSLAKWLTKMNESGQLQRDVAQATQVLTGAFEGIKAVVVPMAQVFSTLGKAVGGMRNEIKLLVEAVAVVKFAKLVSGLTGVGAAAGEAGAAGEVGLLSSRLGALKAFGAAGAIVISVEIVRKIVDSKTGKKFGLDFSGLDLVDDIKKGAEAIARKSPQFGFGPFGSEGEKSGEEASNAFSDGFGKGFAGIVNKLVAQEQAAFANAQQFLTQPITNAIEEAQKRIAIFTLKPAQVLEIQAADRPDDVGVLRKQLAFDKARIADLRRRRDAGKVGAKSFTATITNFLNDRNQTSDRINSIVKAASDDAKSKAKERTDNLNKLFDTSISGALDRVQDFGIGKQVSALKGIAGQIAKRIAGTKDVLRRRELEDQLLGVIRQQKAARQQVAQNLIDSLALNVDKASVTKGLADDLSAITAEQKAIQARIKSEGKTVELQRDLFDIQQRLIAARNQQRENRADARNARQFKALGLTATGEDLVPGVGALKRQLKGLDAGIEGSFLDTKKTRSLISHLKQVLSGGLGEVGRTVRSKVQQMLDDLDGQLKGHEGTVTKFRHVSTAKLLEGLGLSGEQLRMARLRLSVLGPGGTVPGIRQPAFAPPQAPTAVARKPLVKPVAAAVRAPAVKPVVVKPPVVKSAPAIRKPQAVTPVAITRKPGATPLAVERKPLVKPIVITVKPVIKLVTVTVKAVVKPVAAVRKAVSTALPAARKPLVKSGVVARQPVPRLVATAVRKPPVKQTAPILRRVSPPRHLPVPALRLPRQRPIPAVPVQAVRIPRVRHPVPAAATQRERQTAPASTAATYHIEHLHINRPIGDPRQLEDQLQKRTRSRANVRRGA